MTRSSDGLNGEPKVRPKASQNLLIRRTIGRSLVVAGTINHRPVSLTVDTAAMITPVSDKLQLDMSEVVETVTLHGIGPHPVEGKIIP